MANHGKIIVQDLEEMARICAELTRQSIVFTARENGKEWEIELTGF